MPISANIFRLLVLALLLLCPSTHAFASTKLALLIGNSRYEHAKPLRNPENDITVVGKALEHAGFKTVRHENLDAAGMLRAIDSFSRLALKANNPIVVFYYAGHGVTLADENYLLPIDVKTGSNKQIRSGALSFKSVQDKFDAIRPTLQVLILDACRDDPSTTRSLTRGLVRTRIQPINPGKRSASHIGTVHAFSTNPGNVAQDGDSGTSPYASALAEAILYPGLSLEDVFKRTRRLVRERTRGQQEPWENVALYQQFYFHPPRAASNPSRNETDFWELASLVDSIESMRRYLERYPNGLFAGIARQKIENMNRDFSYRRKAETFSIFKLRQLNFNLCNYWKNRQGFNPYELGSKYNNHIIYLDIVLSFEDVACPYMFHVDNRWGTQIFGKPNPRINGAKFKQLERRAASLARSLGIRKWAHAVLAGEITLFLPMGGTDYSEHQDCEMLCVAYRGLVKVRARPMEETLWVYFEPVDPAKVGLTWKFQNTKQVAAELKEDEFIVAGKRKTLR